jgi:hypothetical protein
MPVGTPAGDLTAADVPVVLELGSGLEALRTDPLEAALEQRAAEPLGLVLRDLGVPGRPRIGLRAGTVGRAVQIRVHGRLQPFPPGLLRVAWWTRMPPALRTVAKNDPAAHVGYPDGWLGAYAARQGKSRSVPGFAEFLADVALLVVERRPSCLLRPADSEQGPASTAAEVGRRRAARALLDLGVPAEEGTPPVAGRSADERIERSFERLRRQQIELRIAAADVERMVGAQEDTATEVWVHDDAVEPAIRKSFEVFEIEHYALRGFRLPPVYFTRDEDVPSGRVAVRVNSLAGTPLAGIPPGRDLFPLVSRYRDVEAGSVAWVDKVVIPTLARAVDAAPERLLGMSDVEYLIATFEGGFPDLVRAALAQFSLPGLTTVLRELVRERVCIRDLRTILEALLHYEWVGVDVGERAVFEERVVLPEAITSEVANDLAFRAEAAQQALAAPLPRRSDSDGGRGHRVVGVERSLEAQLEQAAIQPPARSAPPPLSDADHLHLLDHAWRAADGRALVVVTSAGARAMLRELLATEMPTVSVRVRGDPLLDQPTTSLAAGAEEEAGRSVAVT